MKPVQQIILNIPEPCLQNWDEMTPSGKGRFCNHCSRTIIDFSRMSDAALLRHIQEAASGGICGRFSREQLNRPLCRLQSPQFSYRLLYAFLSLGLTAFTATKVQAKAPVAQYESPCQAGDSDTGGTWVSGHVQDFFSGRLTPGASIYLLYQGSTVAKAEADSNGFYKIAVPETYTGKQLNIRTGVAEQIFVVSRGNNTVNLRYHTLFTTKTVHAEDMNLVMGVPPLDLRSVPVYIGGGRIPQTVQFIDGAPVKNSRHKKNFFRRLLFWK